MKISVENLKLFVVEFGQPDLGNYISFGGKQKPLFVMAKNYNEAAEKAMTFAESRAENQSVVGYDGSLNISPDDELKIKSVKLACDEIVW